MRCRLNAVSLARQVCRHAFLVARDRLSPLFGVHGREPQLRQNAGELWVQKPLHLWVPGFILIIPRWRLHDEHCLVQSDPCRSA